jgi:tetratricopeptide (TPR) repeat protein
MSAGLLVIIALASPPAIEEPRAPEAHKQALAKFGAGLWQARRDRLLSAIKSLEAAAKQDPDSTAALKELISVYAQIGREPDAVRAARTVLEKDPHDADTAHALARLLSDAGEFGEALTFARVAVENIEATARPEKALAIFRDLAALHDRTGDTAGAVAAWKLAVELLTIQRKAIIALVAFTPQEIDVELADAYERLGKALVKDHKSDAAATAFLAAHKLYADPKRVNDRHAAALLDWNLSAAYREKNPAAALAHLEAFLKLQPQSVDPYERLVTLLRRSSRGSEVVATLEKYAAREPKNLSLRVVLAAERARDPESRPLADAAFAKILGETNDLKVLRVVLHSQIEMNRAARIIDFLDLAYKGIKDDGKQTAEARAFAAEQARAILEILRMEPEWANAVLRVAADGLRTGTERQYQTASALGYLAARFKKLPVAEIQYREAMVRAPLASQGEIYLQLMNILALGRKPTDLAELCQEALRRDDLIRIYPLYSAFFNRQLAFALARLGKEEPALAAADKAIAQSADIDRLGFRLSKVEVLGLLEHWDEAIQLCNKLRDEFPGPVDRRRIRYLLSSSLWGAKKRDEAEAELRGILDAEPDHKSACNDLSYHLAEQGRNLDEAETLIRRAIALDRIDRRKSGDFELESAPYLDTLAWVLFRRDKLTDARNLLEKVIAMPEGMTDGVVWDHLGDVRYRLGEKDKAHSAWAEAERLLSADSRGKRDGRLEEVKRKQKRLP